MSELEDFERIMEWALHRASFTTKKWMIPMAEKIAEALDKSDET